MGMVMGGGEDVVNKYNVRLLRDILRVGEGLNGEVMRWGDKVLGKGIDDSWWMSERGSEVMWN